MPQRLKFRNKDTGDTFEFDWNKPEKPTPDELRDIYKQQHPDPPGMMQSAWDFVNKPIQDAWGAANKPIISIIDQPLKGVPHSPTMRQMSEENYAADPTLANRAIKFGGQTASDALSWTSSPMALGMGVVGAGTGAAAEAGYTGLARAGKLALGGASTAFTGSGGKHMYEAKTPEEFLGGAMEAGGGLLGLAHGAMNWRTPPPEVPTKSGGIVPFEGNVEAYKQAYTHGPDPEPPLAPASERGFTELPGRREPPPFTSEATDDTGGYMSGRYGIKPRDWAASDPTLATVPDRLRPPAPNERMFDQMLPAVMRERAMGQVEPIRGGPTFGGGVVTPPEMGGPPQPPPRPRPQPRPRPPVAPPIQEPPIIQPPMQAAVPDMEPLDLGRMPVTGMTPDIEAGPPPLSGQMPEPTPNRMNLGEPRFRGPKQEPQTMPKKAPPVTETVPGEAPGYDADRPYARIDEPNVRALAEVGDMDAIRELHTRGVLEAPKERPGIVRRILGNEAGSAGEQPPETTVAERAARLREGETEEAAGKEANRREEESRRAAMRARVEPDDPFPPSYRQSAMEQGYSSYEIDGAEAAARHFGESVDPSFDLHDFDTHMVENHGEAYQDFMDRWHDNQLSRATRSQARSGTSFRAPESSAGREQFRGEGVQDAEPVPLPGESPVEPTIGPVAPERVPGRRAGVRDLTPIKPDTSGHEMFPVVPEGKLKFGEPLEWKSLPPLAERVHEGEPSQGKLMDVPKFERPEDTIQPVGATEEKQPPIVPRVLSAENDGYGGLTVKFHDRITKQRVQDLFPDARFVYTTERAGVNGRGATYHVSFSGETSAARKAAANTAHAAIKEHLYEPPGKQESFTKDLKSQETWDKLPKLTPEQGRGAVESLDPENAMTSLGREYAHQTLASYRGTYGTGEPGVEHQGHGNYHTLIYRNSRGEIDSVATIGPDTNGKRGISSLVADETKGMAFGRPLMRFLPKLQELDAMRVNGGFSPYTENLIRKALSRYSNERGSTTIPTEIASAILKLFKDEKGEVRLPPDLSETLNKAAIGASKGIKAVGRELASFGVNARNIKSGVDISAPRQAALMIGRKEFWKNTPKLVKAFMNPEVAKEVRTSIALRDSYPRMKKAGVFFADIGKTAGQKGEEGFQGDWAKKLPLIGRSEAAFDAFLSSIRADAFERFAKLSDDMGKNHPAEYRTEEVDGKSKQVKVKDSTDVQIAKLVGNLTGRGDLGKLEPAAKALSAAFFSPRLLASRVQTLRYLLDPTTYEHTDPMVRKEAIKSMLHLATANVLFLGALKTAGQLTGRKDISVELDPISSDFMKGKIGNTRFDAGEGFQQIVRTFAQIAEGKQKSPITGRVSKLGSAPTVDTRLDKAVGFARSKLAPVPGVAADWMAGKTIGGESFDWGKAGLGFITPLIVSDINDVLQDNPGFKIDLPYFGETTVAPKPESIPKLAATAAAASVGVGTQTFGATAPRSGRRRARPLRESRQ